MDFAKFRHRVEIQSRTTVPDEGGGKGSPQWVEVATVWAEVRPLKAGEKVRAMHVTGSISHVVNMRHRIDVKRNQRLIHDGRALVIQGVYDPDEHGRWLVLECEEAR